MISIKQLTYALAVAKTLHFKKAADACSVSQSALSTALAEMEKQLGFQVFERDNKKVLVTPLGDEVLKKARNIKLQLDDIYKLSQAQSKPLSYPLSVGMIPTISPYLLPQILPAINEKYPELQLKVVEDQSHILVDMVRNGDIDTAILALPYPCEGLLTFEFWQENFYWVTHRDDEAARCRRIASDQLEQSKLMLLKDGHCLKDHALAACKFDNFDSTHSLGATSLTTLIHLVAGKLGTTLVPEMALQQLVYSQESLTAIPLDEPGPHRKIAFVVRPNYAGLGDIEGLIKLLKQELKHAED